VSKILVPTRSAEDWRWLLADPVKHWRTGYSAKALAYCWESAPGFPPSVRAVFDSSPFALFHGIEMLLGIPERQVPLRGRGKASCSDLFVLAKSGDDLVSITVEGKVAESFDVLVSEWLLRDSAPETVAPEAVGTEALAAEEELPATADVAGDAKKSGPSAGRLKRFAYLCEMLELDEDVARALRYQLLHRTASALIEAERFNAPHALMLVHSFSQTHEWFDDYKSFAKELGAAVEPNAIAHVGKRAGVELYLGWATGEAEFLTV
jgi:hypothetical protein